MKKRQIIFRAVCALTLVLALAFGVWTVRTATRTAPAAPDMPAEPAGLNIDQLALRYASEAARVDNAYSDSAEGSQSTDGTQSEPEQEQDQEPEQPETEQPDEAQQPPEQAAEEPVRQPESGQGEQAPSDTPAPGPGTDGGVLIITGPDDAGYDDGTGRGDEGEPLPPDWPLEPEQPETPEEPEQTKVPTVQTDLGNRRITEESLPGGLLGFYAYIENGTPDMYLRVHLSNSETAGQWLTASGSDYTAQLVPGSNVITIYLRQGSTTLGSITKTITYQPAKANADEPEKGPHPPVVTTNLDGWSEPVKTREFLFRVSATDYHGMSIRADRISVTLDGVPVTAYTGSDTMEYSLYLTPGALGDTEKHTVTVVAWDDEGNSTYREYTIEYQFIDEGDVIGTTTITLDATALGLGILDSDAIEIRQGEPLSYAIDRFLEKMGYTYENKGSLDSGFYLSRISRSRLCSHASPDDALWKCVEADGITQTNQRDKNSLGEFDYTRESGWMYFVNGTPYGRGLSDYYPNDGDVISIRFTLAMGKDVGGYMGSSSGSLSSYCGLWIDGVYTPNHTFVNGVCTVCGEQDPSHVHEFTEDPATRVESTCTVPGHVTLRCACGETRQEELPLAEHTFVNGVCTVCGAADPSHVHEFVEISRQEPTCTEPGLITRQCSCGEQETETLEPLGHAFGEAQFHWSADGASCTVTHSCTNPGCTHSETAADVTITQTAHQEASCTAEGYTEYQASALLGSETVTGTHRVTIPALGHQFENGSCIRCGEPDPSWVPPEQPEPELPGEDE